VRNATTANAGLLTSLLKEVSRSFYLTLRILPAPVRSQIGLAYLLARATDTIADTEIVPLNDRLIALARLRERILGERTGRLDFKAFTLDRPADTTEGEVQLLRRINEAVALLETFPEADQRDIREVLATITSGQELDLKRFGGATSERIIALETDAELDDYTYRVAGCVGEFWSRICRRNLFPHHPLPDDMLLSDGVRFGKGLQLVNILRDLPCDLRNGRCYLPRERLLREGLEPAQLLDAANAPQAKAIYEPLLALASEHLAAGWNYTNMLPLRQRRVRLACAWPVLIGVRTLALLRAGNPLDAAQRIKVSRAEVRGILLSSVLALPFPARWAGLHARYAAP
jgi:farnesyl-diphosphate farnesyltransferase